MVAKKIFWLGMVGLLFGLTGVQADEIGEKVERPVEQAIATRQKTQEEDVKWRLLKEKLALQLEQLQASVKQLQVQKDELTTATASSRKRIEEKERRLEGIRSIEEEMEPFLLSLVDEIHRVSKSGLPFLMTERRERVQRLEAMLDDPAITLSEKFRKAMEALQVEMEYGLTIETYQEQVELDSELFLVNVFRLGRLGLFFQSLDHSSCGLYDPMAGQWSRLPNIYNRSLQQVIEIAAKRRPAELVNMPLGRVVHP